MVVSIRGTYKIKYRPNGPGTESVYDVDFTPPFRRVNMYEGLLQAVGGAKFPPVETLATEGSQLFFDKLARKKNCDCQEPCTTARLLDKLVSDFLESTSFINPTYLLHGLYKNDGLKKIN